MNAYNLLDRAHHAEFDNFKRQLAALEDDSLGRLIDLLATDTCRARGMNPQFDELRDCAKNVSNIALAVEAYCVTGDPVRDLASMV